MRILIKLLLLGLLSSCQHKAHTHKRLHPVKEQKPFVIIIPSYNNSAYCEKNLRSVFSQKYENYRVIYIDDASTDDTFSKVTAIVSSLNQENRCTLIKNPTNKGALENLYQAIHSCLDHEIIVTVDGDDFLAHEEVLSTLNAAYANPDVWMTYGNYLDYPTFKQKPLICKKIARSVVKQNSYRKHPWVSSHLRTFYASLFKKIEKEDLLLEGKFLPMAWDLAFMFPLLEMSGEHALFIKSTLYLYNRTNPLNDHKVNFELQTKCAHHVRNKTPYSRLNKL